jgi:hypothetical protein
MSDVKIELKGIKLYPAFSEETTAFTATVYVNGEKAFAARNDGQGGCNRYDLLEPLGRSRELLRQAEQHARSLPPKPFLDDELEYDLDLLVDDLLVAWETTRWLKRQCKGKTLFRLPDDEPGEWRVLKTPYTADVRKHLVTQYGEAVHIGNEQL